MNTNEIKKNIIENFLNPYYRYSSVHMPTTVVADIIKRSWFPCTFNKTSNVLTFTIGNNLEINIAINWHQSELNNNIIVIGGFE